MQQMGFSYSIPIFENRHNQPQTAMNLDALLKDKTIKPKEKTAMICRWILDQSLPIDELLSFAEKQKDPAKASCIEAIAFATRQNPRLADENVLDFVTQALTCKAPRIQWESAKVIGNVAHLFPSKLELPIANLLANTKTSGTVVRWSAAFALGEILKLRTSHNTDLSAAITRICESEEKNSIQKIYRDAIKKTENKIAGHGF